MVMVMVVISIVHLDWRIRREAVAGQEDEAEGGENDQRDKNGFFIHKLSFSQLSPIF
jgi:hypothetical protein